MGWLTPGSGIGIEFLAVFDITVQNFGEEAIDGLNITIGKVTEDNDSQYYNYTYVNSTFSVKAAESAQVRVNLETENLHLERIFDNHENFQATLFREAQILDQRKLY